MKYVGKIGKVIPIGIVICMLLSLLVTFYEDGFLISLSLLGIGLVTILWCFPSYLIMECNYIEARMGINKKKIYCDEIVSIHKTNDTRRGFALSIDRIRILCLSGESTLISLIENDEFIKNITSVHPHIKYIEE